MIRCYWYYALIVDEPVVVNTAAGPLPILDAGVDLLWGPFDSHSEAVAGRPQMIAMVRRRYPAALLYASQLEDVRIDIIPVTRTRVTRYNRVHRLIYQRDRIQFPPALHPKMLRDPARRGPTPAAVKQGRELIGV